MTLVVLPGLQVVAGPHILEACPFSRLSLGHQLIGAKLLVREDESHAFARRRRRCGRGATFSMRPMAGGGAGQADARSQLGS